MALAAACPDMQTLQQLAVGRMPPAEVEGLARHCEQCERCIQVLQTLKAEDTLIEAMASQSTNPERPRDAAVDALIERLKRMSPPSAAESEMTATVAGGATPSVDDASIGDVAFAPPQAPGELGRLGVYRVLKVLGAGGMGMVYQAEDVHLQRSVALKVMKPELAKNATARERFLREARAAAKLKSDHVVHIYQVGEERQTVYLAMEYLEGLSLDDWLKKGRTPTPAQAVRIGRQIALGLADAHACGLIHRDIKPGNIWLDSRHQGRVKLLDFGLARGDTDEVHLTQSGAIVGTPAYMAPEQARGEKVDHRADLFSLGVVLYRLTTGRLPFWGVTTMSILTSLALDAPTPPREINANISPRLAALIERLLSKDREQRPATAKAVADELAAIERETSQPADDERTMQVAPTAPVVRAAHVAQRSKRLRWLVAASLLLLVGGVTAAIVVIIRDKQGNKIAEIDVPPGGKIEIQDNGKGEAKAPPAKDDVRIAAPLPPLLPGEPLAPTALVRQPAKLPGVRSWTIETRDPWVPFAPVLAYRPDGARLAAANMDGVIRIFEPQTGRLVQMLLGEGRPIALAWSPDGRGLAAVIEGPKWRIRLWDGETGPILWETNVPGGQPVSAFAWSPDGRSLRVCADACLVLDAVGGKIVRQVPLPCAGGAFSPDGKRVAGLHRQMEGIFIWDTESGEMVRKLGEHVGAVAWSPDGQRLASVWSDALRVWEVETGKEILQRKDLASKGRGFVSWSPDGRTLALIHEPGQPARLLEVSADAKCRELDGPHEEMAWSPDGKTIALAESSIQIHDVATGKRLRSLWEAERGPGINQFALSPDGQTLAMMDGSGQIILSSVDTGHVFKKLEGTTGPLAWSPDGKRLACVGPNHAVLVWEDGAKVRVVLRGHETAVTALAWSPDGKRLASAATGEKRVLIWDADKGEGFRELGPYAAAIEFRWSEFTWSPDSRFLAFKNVPESAWHVVDVEHNKLLNDPKQWQAYGFAFAPDSRSALVQSVANGRYQLRDLATGEERGQLSSRASAATSLTWSPDGRWLAVPVATGIELWRGDRRHRVRMLRTTYAPQSNWPSVAQLAFSRDGKLLAALAGERLHLWETDTGRLRGMLLGKNGLTIAPDGHYTGNEQVERDIVMVVQKDDGTQEVLEPTDFEQKYGWKNEPDKVHLLQPLPPPPYPQPGMPMGPQALVREPAELPDANAMSWTVETLNPRGPVNAVAYRPDGKLLATAGDDGTIRLWDTSSGKLVRMLIGEPVGSLSWSKDGKVLTALRPGDVQGREWDADTGRLLRRVLGAVTPGSRTARSPDGKQTVTADDKGVRITDTATGKVLHALEEIGHIGYHNLSWSPDGRRLAFAYQFPGEAGLRVMEAATGRSGPALAEYERAGAWSPDGKIFATCGRDGRAHLLEAGTYRLLRTLEGDGGDGTALAWSADGKRLAMSAHSALRAWSVPTGKQLWGNDKRAIAVAWSPDGRRLATTDNSNDKAALRLWEAETGRLLREHPLIAEGALAWTPDGKRLVALPMWGEEGLIIDAETGAVHRRLKAGVGNCCVRWSSDGKTFTSLGNQGQLREWDAAAGEVRRATQLPGVVGYIASAAWSPDGQMLVWASGDAIHLHDAIGEPLGVLLPLGAFGQLAVTADGHYRGNARIERQVRMVVQKRDGTSETLTVGEFEQKYGFKNDPAQVRLLGE